METSCAGRRHSAVADQWQPSGSPGHQLLSCALAILATYTREHRDYSYCYIELASGRFREIKFG